MDYSVKTISEWTRLGTRKAFGKQIEFIAEENKDVIVLTADVANSANLDSFNSRFPNQFYNIGIAEANMTGIAAGLAKEGSNVFLTSFAPFVTMRNYEAIRTLIGYMHLNVKVVGLASGMSLGAQGNTHYSLEDIALMNAIPGMLILSPIDVVEEAKCLEYLSKYNGPAYLRLTGIDGNACVFKANSEIEITKLQQLREGEDVAVIVTGSVAGECIRAARALKKENISCAVYDACCLKPFDSAGIVRLLNSYKNIVIVEEHHEVGGLGSIIKNYIAEGEYDIHLKHIAIKDHYPETGDYSYLLSNNCLDALSIKDKILEFLK